MYSNKDKIEFTWAFAQARSTWEVALRWYITYLYAEYRHVHTAV